MQNPKISIIIPVYNGEKTLHECLNSVLNQSYKDYEVIIVNNNSTDNTRNIIKSFQKKNKKINYLFEKEIGRGPARNTGERAAKGEIILMTDCDCIVPENWVEEMINPIIEEDYDAVQGFIKPAENNFWSNQYQIGTLEKFTKKDKKIIDEISTVNFAIKKSILRNAGYTSRNLRILIDLELSIRLQQNKIKIKNIDVKITHHHITSAPKIIKNFFLRGKTYPEVFNKHKEYLKKTNSLRHYKIIYPNMGRLLKILKSRGLGGLSYILITETSFRIGMAIGNLYKITNLN